MMSIERRAQNGVLKDIDIKKFPVQQQRFIRGGRAYLEKNPDTKFMKEVRFPLEPVPGKGKGAGRRGGGRGGGRGRVAAPIIGAGDFTVNEMLGGEFNETSFDEWLNAAQGAPMLSFVRPARVPSLPCTPLG